MLNALERLMNEIISECVSAINSNSSPNRFVIEVILKEFTEIKEFYILHRKILLLSNKNWKLWSVRTIIDSADFNFDNMIFDKVREFEKLCNHLESTTIVYKY